MVTKQDIQSIDPYDFEELVAKLWDNKGYTTNLRKKSNDKGIDIEAKKGDIKEVIQVKRYSEGNKIGSADVRKYATLYQQTDANNVVLVTSGGVTKQARDLADDLNIKIIDGSGVVRQFNKYSIKTNNKNSKRSYSKKSNKRLSSSSTSKRSTSGGSTKNNSNLDVSQKEHVQPNSAGGVEFGRRVLGGIIHIIGVLLIAMFYAWVPPIFLNDVHVNYYESSIIPVTLSYFTMAFGTLFFWVRDVGEAEGEKVRLGTAALIILYLFLGIIFAFSFIANLFI